MKGMSGIIRKLHQEDEIKSNAEIKQHKGLGVAR